MFGSAFFLAVLGITSYALYREHQKLKRESRAAVTDYSKTRSNENFRRETSQRGFVRGSDEFVDVRTGQVLPSRMSQQGRPLSDDAFLAAIDNRMNRVRTRERWQGLQSAGVVGQPNYVLAWRRAVKGLMANALLDVNDAKVLWLKEDFVRAVLLASLGVEKIARALLHCHGIKPNLGYGQAEELRLLQAVAKETRTEEFGETIVLAEKFARAKAVIESKHIYSVVPVEFSERKMTKRLCDEAKECVEFYRRIIEERFGDELGG